MKSSSSGEVRKTSRLRAWARGIMGGAVFATSLFGGSCAATDLGDVETIQLAAHTDDWRDQIIYQLLTDRFANGDSSNDYRIDASALARYQGGDYEGIVQHLDYLEELGVTALWISPIVLNVDHDAGVDAYHGYWAVDLERLNPHFGDLASLRRFVREAHRRDMLVILDIVTNHLGQVFYYDINGNGTPDDNVIGSGRPDSPVTRVTEYDPDFDPRGIQGFTSLGESGPAPVRFFDMPEIFRVLPNPAAFANPDAYNRRGRITDYNIPEQVVLGDFPGGLKDLDTTRQDVRDAMVDSYVRWVLLTDLDGFRIDTLKHVEHEFWEDFAPRVRQRLAAAGKNNFFMFGEAFDGSDSLIGSYTQPNQLDSVFYFSQKFWIFNDVFTNGQATQHIADLYAMRDQNYGQTPQPGGIGVAPRDVLVNFMDNHDVPRFAYLQRDVRALHAALAYLFTEDGIPCLYYGTEQNFAGGNDPQNREVLWRSGYRTDGETFRWTSRLTHIRRAYRALTHGTFAFTWATPRTGEAEDAGIVAFERVTPEGQYALVVINAQGDHESHTSFEGSSMEVHVPDGITQLVDVLTGETVSVDGGRVLATVEGFGTRIYVPTSQRIAGL